MSRGTLSGSRPPVQAARPTSIVVRVSFVAFIAANRDELFPRKPAQAPGAR